jgi:hypothetical protein
VVTFLSTLCVVSVRNFTYFVFYFSSIIHLALAFFMAYVANHGYLIKFLYSLDGVILVRLSWLRLALPLDQVLSERSLC